MAAVRPNPIRTLFWGLLCFAVLMLFSAWAGIGELVVPPSSGPGVRLVDMPPPLLAVNAVLCALPVAAFILILAGVAGMMWFVPGVGRRLVWRIGNHEVTAIMVAGSIVLAYAALFAGFLVLAFLQLGGTPLDPLVGLAAGVVFSAIPIGLGWYLMLLSGWSLSVITRGRERAAVIAAVAWAGGFAVLLIVAEVFATIAMGSAALDSSAQVPAHVPWADAASGTAGFAALVVLTVVARRAARRFRVLGSAAAPQPA